VEELLIKTVTERMSRDGRDLAHLDRAREVVVFGSYASGLNTPESDIDVLCIGSGPRLKSRNLDLLWIAEHKLGGTEWLGSELAGHIAKYGVWVRGDGSWRTSVFSGAHSIETKRKRVISLSRTAIHFWSRLHSTFQHQYDLAIRRELQRLELLLKHFQIPPTKVLDNDWCNNRTSVLRLKSSIPELRAYEGQSNIPTILSLPA
jgi:hypothetical protein